MTYTYQLHAEIDERKLIFEKDDEGKFRVIDQSGDVTPVEKGLILAIISTLDNL